MVGDLPGQAVYARLGRQLAGVIHLGLAVVPPEQDVPPVEERQIPAGPALLVRHRPQRAQRSVESAPLPVAGVALGERAVDREGDLVDAGVNQPDGLRLTQGQSVGARVEIGPREPLLDVLAHLHGTFVQERLAVVEEVDPREARTGLVDHAREEIEVEHAGLPGPRDPGLGRAAGLEAGDVARRGALDVEAGGQRAGVDRPDAGRRVAGQRQLEGAVAAEPGAARVEVGPQAPNRRGVPDLRERLCPRVAQHALHVRVGAAADHAPVAREHERAPGPGATEAGGEMIQRHRPAACRGLRRGGAAAQHSS